MGNATAPLRFREKVGYGLGDAASNMYLEFFGIFALYYYIDVVGLDPVAVGTMFLVTKIIDSVTDPAMGMIADRTRTRWGRFRPYLLWMAIPFGLSGYLVFLDIGSTPDQKLAYAYAAYSFMMLSYTAINVPYSGLLGVIHSSTGERTKATVFRFFFASLGSIIVAAFATPFTTLLGGGDDGLGIRRTMALIALFASGMFVVCFFTTRERIPPKIEMVSLRASVKDLFGNPHWRVLGLSMVLLMTGLVAHLGVGLYYLIHVIGADNTAVFWIFDRPALFFLSSSIGWMLGVLISRRTMASIGKLKTMRLGLAGYALTVTLFFLLPEEAFAVTCLLQALNMVLFGHSIVPAFAMYTDCAEFNEWRTDRQTTGLVIAASLFAMKLGMALGGALPAFVLGAFGFVAGETQDAEAILGIRLTFSLVSGLLVAAAAVLMLFYRLDRKVMHRVEADLAQRRAPLAA